MTAITLCVAIGGAWLVAVTHPKLTQRQRQAVELLGAFGVRSAGLIFLCWIGRKGLGWSPAALLAVVLLFFWQFDLIHLIRQMSEFCDEADVSERRDDGMDDVEIGDCLTHYELEFYIRNRGQTSGPYARDLFRIKMHVRSCGKCRRQLTRDEEELRRRADPEDT